MKVKINLGNAVYITLIIVLLVSIIGILTSNYEYSKSFQVIVSLGWLLSLVSDLFNKED